MTVAETFADQVTRDLIEQAPLMRLAYTATDGSPRVVPSGYLERDTQLIIATAPRAPKVIALRADPRVAVTIDVGGMPPRCLLVRGTASVEIVDGIPQEYLDASRRTMSAEAYVQWEEGVRALFDEMALITITPTWAKLLDFERTVPDEIARLAAAKQAAG